MKKKMSEWNEQNVDQFTYAFQVFIKKRKN